MGGYYKKNCFFITKQVGRSVEAVSAMVQLTDEMKRFFEDEKERTVADIAAGVLLVNYDEEAGARTQARAEELAEVDVVNGNGGAEETDELDQLPAWMNVTTPAGSAQWDATLRYMDLALGIYTWPPFYLYTLWRQDGSGMFAILV